VISGVARFGVFVTLDTHFVDGLIAGRSLGEGLELEPSKLAAVGRRSGRRYAIGQRVRVRVGGVDADRARVWLEWADAERAAPRRPERDYKRASGGTQRRARSPR
jgi:ribonuclease R